MINTMDFLDILFIFDKKCDRISMVSIHYETELSSKKFKLKDLHPVIGVRTEGLSCQKKRYQNQKSKPNKSL
ncbi:hypothetical protein [Clostridium ganghwense]|uniref:hypothetical protein n=1 Tax=Clostridium ganghwense TaxID=312089 RepID=UPI00227A079A|nr:hypothetical protein [Clostridium ganghwense]